MSTATAGTNILVAMNIFISWSGDRSKNMAEALRIWLPRVIQSVHPWVSGHNLGKGSKWSTVLSSELGSHVYGIICVTPENREKPWIMFEAGALSKTDESRTYTLLLGLGPSDIEQPLAQFNHTLAEENDLRALIRGINEATANPVNEDVLEHSFNLNWPFLQERIDAILTAGDTSSVTTPTPEAAQGLRDERSMIAEMLQLLRAQNSAGPTLIGSSSDAKIRITARIVQGIIEEVLREISVVAQITVQRESSGNFAVRIFPSTGGSMGLKISGSSTPEDVAVRIRTAAAGFATAWEEASTRRTGLGDDA